MLLFALLDAKAYKFRRLFVQTHSSNWQYVPQTSILDAAEDVGISFGIILIQHVGATDECFAKMPQADGGMDGSCCTYGWDTHSCLSSKGGGG